MYNGANDNQINQKAIKIMFKSKDSSKRISPNMAAC